MTINPLMQQALGVDVPEEPQPESRITLPVIVEPHELPPPVDNPEAPNMEDIHRRQVEAEKQLEELIHLGQTIVEDLYKNELPACEPKYRRGVMEQIAFMFERTLHAVEIKNKLQLDKQKARLAQAGFSKKTKPGQVGGTTNMFFGTREQMVELMEQEGLLKRDE